MIINKILNNKILRNKIILIIISQKIINHMCQQINLILLINNRNKSL